LQKKLEHISNKPYSHFGAFSNKCTKSKKSPLKSDTITYLFSFNGQERDDEVSGVGNIMTAEFWEYDARLGRRWNIDPATSEKPWMSPYHSFSNKPILNIDPNGANDDDYKLNKDGSIDLINKTEDPIDRIYATDQKGDVDCSNSIEVEKGVIGNGKYAYISNRKNPESQFVKIDIYKIQGDNNSKRLFEFVAKNANVEWGLTMTGEKGDAGLNYLTTTHLEGGEFGASSLFNNIINYKGLRFRVHIHNHPRQSNASPPDIYNARILQKLYPGSQFFIYKSKMDSYSEYNGKSDPMQLLDELFIRPQK
jgi:RHS repeat-associated protein